MKTIEKAPKQVWMVNGEGEYVLQEHMRDIKDQQSNFVEAVEEDLEIVDNLTALKDLHNGIILHQLKQRFFRDQIYTDVGNVLLCTNPYKPVELCTSELVLKSYRSRICLLPHIFKTASRCCYEVLETNQSCIISGESGAGKTETAQLFIKYTSKHFNNTDETIGRKIFLSGIVLESFGNASTAFNQNSSRFGKFTKIVLTNLNNGSRQKVISMKDERFRIAGCQISNYLLEKSRVTKQNEGEMCFHIYYELLQLLKKCLCSDSIEGILLNRTIVRFKDWKNEIEEIIFNIGEEKCSFLNWNFNEEEADTKLLELFSVLEELEFSSKIVFDMFSCVLFILLLGMIHPSSDENLKFKSLLHSVAGVDYDSLIKLLETKAYKFKHETVTKQRTTDQFIETRDVLAKTLYGALFSFVTSEINRKINQDGRFDPSSVYFDSRQGKGAFRFIGVLDIFGFETFESNYFEQFLINYCNEKINNYFLRNLIQVEIQEYEKYGIQFDFTPSFSNSICLHFLESHPESVINIVNDLSKLSIAADLKIVERLRNKHGAEDTIEFDIKKRNIFSLVHYAGKVRYDVTEFLHKNRDNVDLEISNFLASSTKFSFCQKHNESTKGARTVLHKFRAELNNLTAMFDTSAVSFVRCFKPNKKQIGGDFDEAYVLRQLKYSGVLSISKIRKLGFSHRLSNLTFYETFWQLGQNVKCAGGNGSTLLENLRFIQDSKLKSLILSIEKRGIISSSGFQIGRNEEGNILVFMNDLQNLKMEDTLRNLRNEASLKIVAFFSAFKSRKKAIRFLQCSRQLKQSLREKNICISECNKAMQNYRNAIIFKTIDHFLIAQATEICLTTLKYRSFRTIILENFRRWKKNATELRRRRKATTKALVKLSEVMENFIIQQNLRRKREAIEILRTHAFLKRIEYIEKSKLQLMKMKGLLEENNNLVRKFQRSRNLESARRFIKALQEMNANKLMSKETPDQSLNESQENQEVVTCRRVIEIPDSDDESVSESDLEDQMLFVRKSSQSRSLKSLAGSSTGTGSVKGGLIESLSCVKQKQAFDDNIQNLEPDVSSVLKDNSLVKLKTVEYMCKRMEGLKHLEMLMVSLRHYELGTVGKGRGSVRLSGKLFDLQQLKLAAQIRTLEEKNLHCEQVRLAKTLLRAIKLRKVQKTMKHRK